MVKKHAVLLLSAVADALDSASEKLEQLGYSNEARITRIIKELTEIVLLELGYDYERAKNNRSNKATAKTNRVSANNNGETVKNN